MRAMIAWVMMICVAGCATMQTVTGSSLELQERIAAGELLQPGDHVTLRFALSVCAPVAVEFL